MCLFICINMVDERVIKCERLDTRYMYVYIHVALEDEVKRTRMYCMYVCVYECVGVRACEYECVCVCVSVCVRRTRYLSGRDIMLHCAELYSHRHTFTQLHSPVLVYSYFTEQC